MKNIRFFLTILLTSFILIGCSEEIAEVPTAPATTELKNFEPEIGVVDENNNPVESIIVENAIDEAHNTEVLQEEAVLQDVNTSTEEVIEETSDTEEENQSIVSEETAQGLGNLEVQFLDVGQADCILIKCNGEAMLIDAGEDTSAGSKGTGVYVQNALNKQGISSLKYIVATHPDSDHIGNLDVIVTKFPVETFLMTQRDGETKTYDELLGALKSARTNVEYPNIGNNYSLGNAIFTVLGPYSITENDNDSSIVIKLAFGNTSFLFMGDAQSNEENDIYNSGSDISADVIKIGHHGSDSSSGYNFIQKVHPKYAVISCGAENSYGHPHAQTLNTLRSLGIDTYRTDTDGTIIFYSDGNNILFNKSPSNNWVAGENTQNSVTTASSPTAKIIDNTKKEENTDINATPSVNNVPATSPSEHPDFSSAEEMRSYADGQGYVYVGNAKKNKMKLHKVHGCSKPPYSVVEFFNTEEEAQAAGYKVENYCKNCW